MKDQILGSLLLLTFIPLLCFASFVSDVWLAFRVNLSILDDFFTKGPVAAMNLVRGHRDRM